MELFRIFLSGRPASIRVTGSYPVINRFPLFSIGRDRKQGHPLISLGRFVMGE